MADSGKHKKFDIEGLYRSAFRTKSYEDILKEFQEDLKPITHHEEQEQAAAAEVVCPLPDPVHLTSDFDEEGMESLLPDAVQAPLHDLLRDYMESATKAYDFCYLLLKSIKRARANACVLRRVVRMHKCDLPCEGTTAEERRRVFTDLVRVAQLDNPLSQPELASSPATEGMYAPVIPQLRSLLRREARRRSGFVGFCIKAMGTAVPACGASRRGQLAGLGARLDEAARGGYVLDREFHTLGRMLARVNDEIEHGRIVVREFLQGRPGRYPWREVMRLLQTEEGWLLEQLQELEQHAYLCLLTINRARKALLQGELSSLVHS
ncbi:hypothetical protein Taro_041920 [Colocasia esculenta]|uniref:Uncharacterized protein n=1 Tax=Colocasia esculenta TaxID=4460 RepID=A0A843WH41_COLES|nr:hypothetical protein [Colocasia esculenta]